MTKIALSCKKIYRRADYKGKKCRIHDRRERKACPTNASSRVCFEVFLSFGKAAAD